MRRRLLGPLLAAVVFALASCSSDLPEGPAGRVVGKDSDRTCTMTGTGKTRHQTCSTDYELTTRDKKGESHEFEVSSDDYDDCYRGSKYPKCTKR